MQPDLTGIWAFICVIEQGSFSAAARLLNVTQPALSRRVSKLETSLGVTLIRRTTRRIELTDAGNAFFPEACRLRDQLSATLMNIREFSSSVSGRITLSCLPTAAIYFLPEVIRRFNKVYPKIQIRILELGAYDCLEAVLNNDAEFGINMMNVVHPDIEFTPLVSEPFVLACRRDHPLAQHKLISWQQLADIPLIGVRRSSGNRILIEQALSKDHWQPNWFYEVRHLSTSLGMVEAGLAITAVPGLAMPRDEHPLLISRPLINPVVRRTMGIIHHRQFRLKPAAKMFKEQLLALWENESATPWINKFNL